jgi:hypothetical protein
LGALPPDFHPEAIDAASQGGILKVTLDKGEEPKLKKVPVKTKAQFLAPCSGDEESSHRPHWCM